MRKAILLVLLAASAAAGRVQADLARNLPPDSKTTQNAVYARRGTLGANDYVVTNIPPITSSYVMNTVSSGKLRDRAVNTARVSGAFASFELPLKRTVSGFARGMIFIVTAERETEISLTGGERLWGTCSKTATLKLCEGTHLLQIIEIGNAEYLVETRELVEFKDN